MQRALIKGTKSNITYFKTVLPFNILSKVVIYNFTDFELLYDKFAALPYNEDKFEILKQCSERLFLHVYE